MDGVGARRALLLSEAYSNEIDVVRATTPRLDRPVDVCSQSHPVERCLSDLTGSGTRRQVTARPWDTSPGHRSEDSAGAELHADAGTDGPGGLEDRMLPGALARATHHHQIAVPQREADRFATATRTQ